MGNLFEEVLERVNTGAVAQPGDRDVIREALRNQIGVAFYFRDRQWTIGQEEYPNRIGFAHIRKLLIRPGDKLQLHANENGRKAIQKSIRRAIDLVQKSQPIIGLHLQNCVKTGELCGYVGGWVWTFAP